MNISKLPKWSIKGIPLSIDYRNRLSLGISKSELIMEDKDILVKRYPFKEKIKTIGHQMPDGWWYVYTPFDKEWHFVSNNDVEIFN